VLVFCGFKHLMMFWVGSVAGRGQIDISWVLPFSLEFKVYLLLSRRGVRTDKLWSLLRKPALMICRSAPYQPQNRPRTFITCLNPQKTSIVYYILYYTLGWLRSHHQT